MPFPSTQKETLPAYFQHCSFIAERKAKICERQFLNLCFARWICATNLPHGSSRYTSSTFDYTYTIDQTIKL